MKQSPPTPVGPASSAWLDLGNNKVLLIVVLVVVVAGILTGVYFLTKGSEEQEPDGSSVKLSKEEAERQCLKCVDVNCPSTTYGDPLKACQALVETVACGCKGPCASQCKQANDYTPDVCTKLFCSVGVGQPSGIFVGIGQASGVPK